MNSTVPDALRIRLLSSLQAGELPAGSLSVDQEVPLDDYGLPYIPRRRVAARLRDALDQVSLAWPGETGDTARRHLTGTARSTDSRRILVLGDGCINAGIRRAVMALAARHGG